MNIVKQGIFTSLSEIGGLRIIDFNRCNGLWENNPVSAMKVAENFLVEHFQYTVIETDMRESPERRDWPGWRHVGNHVPLGRRYWNWFFEKGPAGGTLEFSDSPDFNGTFYNSTVGREVSFFGDIGMVSASTFLVDVVPRMRHGDLWISIPHDTTQIILEARCDIGFIIKTALERCYDC